MDNKQIDVRAEDGEITIEIDGYPDDCPICHKGIDARYQWGYLFNNDAYVEAIFQCPLKGCRHLFIAHYYQQIGGWTGSRHDIYYLSKTEPQTPNPREFSKEIASISGSFIKIFNEAHRAEELDLLEIVGPGYRKALEFLIKDYAISRNPNEAEPIKRIQLGQVISQYISDTKIKSTASIAAWLGNDETHYYRKWEGKDIADLKLLIELTVRWIESEELTRQYENDMKK